MNKIFSTDQSFLDSLYKTIEDNLLNEQFGVEELAREIGISRTQLHRRLQNLTGQSTSQLIREYRLKKAKALLEKEEMLSYMSLYYNRRSSKQYPDQY